MKKLFSTLSILLIMFSASAGVGEPIFDHTTWHRLLQKHVSSEGSVDYEGFQKDRDMLKSYLSELNVQTPQSKWGKDATMAYWINAYNAFTVELILRNYPTSSIKNINSGKAWDLKFIELGGETYSLNNIEHDILRKRYKDARVHFAVNCASVSCPKLINVAFSEVDLDLQLQTAAKRFIDNQSKNTITAEKAEVSKLFDWYKDDFMLNGSVKGYLNSFSKVKIAPETKITFKDYNWNLNK